MLKIFEELSLFFEDVYREISVREYSRLMKISAPTASKLLKKFEVEGILILEKKGIYIYYRSDKNSELFKGLVEIYWKLKLKKVFEELHNVFLFKQIILFGSIAKQENTFESDIDLFVDIPKKEIDLKSIEKKLKRKIQIHFSDSFKNKGLKENIKGGIVIL